MSFLCAQCRTSSLPRIPATQIILETRPMAYLNYDEDGEEVVSRGEEIVKEVKMCPGCASEFERTAK